MPRVDIKWGQNTTKELYFDQIARGKHKRYYQLLRNPRHMESVAITFYPDDNEIVVTPYRDGREGSEPVITRTYIPDSAVQELIKKLDKHYEAGGGESHNDKFSVGQVWKETHGDQHELVIDEVKEDTVVYSNRNTLAEGLEMDKDTFAKEHKLLGMA